MSFASRSASTEKEQHLSDAEFEKENAALQVQRDEGVEAGEAQEGSWHMMS